MNLHLYHENQNDCIPTTSHDLNDPELPSVAGDALFQLDDASHAAALKKR